MREDIEPSTESAVDDLGASLREWRPRGAKVALVHDWLTGMRGGEKVLEAIAELFPGAPIHTLFCFEDSISDALKRHPIRTSGLQGEVPERLLRKHYRYLLPFFPTAIEGFDLGSYDLLISTSHCVAKGALPGPDTLHFCYCHSPMRYAWDMEHHYFPKRRGPIAELRNAILSQMRTWDVASVPRVDHFWANSDFVARRIRRFYGRDASVLHPPVEVDAFAAPTIDAPPSSASAPSVEGDYALAVSALVPYKRLDLAIQAAEQAGIDLRIVGTGPEEKKLRKLCRKHARLLGRVDDDELRSLYRGARFFLQPGIEDFGIAAVESLASGTPVVAIGRGGVADIVEDGAHGVLYDGFEVDDVASAIDKCLQIRFNPLELEQKARSFSRRRFIRRLAGSIRRHLDPHLPGSASNRRPEIPVDPRPQDSIPSETT